MATDYYFVDKGDRIPLPPGLVKIARFVAKRRGEDWGDILNQIVNRLIRKSLDRGPEAMQARIDADIRYCEAEGLDLETFRTARANFNAESAYWQLRREVGASPWVDLP